MTKSSSRKRTSVESALDAYTKQRKDSKKRYTDQGDSSGKSTVKGHGQYPTNVNNIDRHTFISDDAGNGSSLAPPQHVPRSLYRANQPGLKNFQPKKFLIS